MSIHGTLEFEFYYGTNVRIPSKSEVSGLLNQTDRFYTERLRQHILVWVLSDPSLLVLSLNKPTFPAEYIIINATSWFNGEMPTAEGVLTTMLNISGYSGM